MSNFDSSCKVTKNSSLNSILGLALTLLTPQATLAAITDIANAPLFTSSVSNVKSNIMFIFDDSGSMYSSYLPDDAPSGTSWYGYTSSQCNGIAYNPSIKYTLPVNADGTSYPNSSFTAAKRDGFSTASGNTADLSQNWNLNYYYKYKGSQTPLNYSYSGSSLDTNSTFYKECHSAIGSSPGAEVFEKVDIRNGTTAEKQNYANWYTYYSDRYLLMKTSVGLAFAAVDSKYRVGFNIINNKSASGNDFLDIKDFDATQKSAFYAKLYATSNDGYTPLRGALSLAGQYFANKAPGQTVDPVQYSCQKNFSILSTDGYWNKNAESTSAPKYGPYQLDNTTTVGQQDGAGTARPMLDGSTVILKSRTSQLQSSSYRFTMVTSKLQQQTSIAQFAPTTANLQKQTTQLQAKTRSLETRTRASGATWTGWTKVASCTVATASPRRECRYHSSTESLSDVDSCTAQDIPPTNVDGVTYSVANIVTACSTRISEPYANAASCTVNTTPDASGQTTQCKYGTPQTAGAGSYTTSCTVSPSASVASFSIPIHTSACAVKTPLIGSAYANVDSCTVTTTPDTDGKTYQCKYSAGISSTVIGTCTPVAASTSSPYTVGTAVTCTPTSNSAWSDVSYCDTNQTGISGCQYVYKPSSNFQTVNACVEVPRSTASPYTVGLATECQSTSTGGSSDTLADIAMYYYKTDLRDGSLSNCTGALGTSVCDNNVAGGGRDTATHQHMTTFTLGMGNSGTLKYDPKYLSQSSGDFFDITQGTKNWPKPDGGAENIDDLWHAAVNGRGQFFSASEPSSLTAGLNAALDSIKTITGAASAAATSSLQPVQGNNDVYVAQFTSGKWTGDVSSYKIEPATGVVSSTATWSAQAKLDGANPAARKIYYPKSGALREFTYTNLTVDGLQNHFDGFCNKAGAGATTAPSQCSSENTSNNAVANLGTNLVNFLRGVQTHSNDQVYRSREHVLGDIINASPLFVGKPAFKYSENGYGSFSSSSTRPAVVYAAANDGMLHAFDQATGDERWAFIPSFVLPNMYKLADANYPNNHVFMVDGSPVMGDIYVNSAWKTIVVGGLNAGGRGYYALDVTDPLNPKMLWEFSDTDLGYTFGNPVITKKNDGTWVVVFSSGYNNVSPGDGNGYLYVLNANTGALLSKLGTNVSGAAVGNTTTPSGLNKINTYVESDVNNTTKVVYGGDLLGNVWRFDIDSVVKPYLSAMRLAELKVGTKPQPITSKPALAEVSYNGAKYKVIYVGTGRYLGMSDLANTDTQTIYALKDSWSETGLGNVRLLTNQANEMVVQTATTATSATQGNIVKGTAKPVNWTTHSGWYLDFISSGERVSVNPLLVLNALYVGTNVPKNDACTVGGTSWLYKLDIAKGSAIANSPESAIAVSLGNVLIMGMTNVQLTTGSVATIVTRSDGTLKTVTGAQPTIAGNLRRTSWRTLK